jgi:cysteine desulfurase
MKQIIYADNAATTKLDIEAFEAMKPFLLDDYSNASQPYSFSRGAKKAFHLLPTILENGVCTSRLQTIVQGRGW